MNLPLYLYVTPFFPSAESWRGSYSYDFVQALRRTRKFDIRVFMPGDGCDYDYQGVRVHRFATHQLPSAILPLLFARSNQRSFLNRLSALGIDLARVAVCHANVAISGIYPLAIKAVNPNCLTLLHHHDLASYGLNNGILHTFWLHQLLLYPQLRAIHEAIDCHVFVSGAAKKSFLAAPDASWTLYADYVKQMRGLSMFRSPNIRNAFVLHNGVDRSQFFVKSSEAKTRSDSEYCSEGGSTANRAGSFTMGAIGNFNEVKDHLSLLTACAMISNQLGDWKLRLIGTGSTLAKCQEFVEAHSLGDHVSFEATMDHADLPEFYRSLDLFVLPSYFEGFGCVFTEAAASGVPFITCEGQGMDDLVPVDDRPFWLCKPKDPVDLSRKILRYFIERPEQQLHGPIDIDIIVPRFVAQLETFRCEWARL